MINQLSPAWISVELPDMTQTLNILDIANFLLTLKCLCLV